MKEVHTSGRMRWPKNLKKSTQKLLKKGKFELIHLILSPNPAYFFLGGGISISCSMVNFPQGIHPFGPWGNGKPSPVASHVHSPVAWRICCWLSFFCPKCPGGSETRFYRLGSLHRDFLRGDGVGGGFKYMCFFIFIPDDFGKVSRFWLELKPFRCPKHISDFSPITQTHPKW